MSRRWAALAEVRARADEALRRGEDDPSATFPLPHELKPEEDKELVDLGTSSHTIGKEEPGKRK